MESVEGIKIRGLPTITQARVRIGVLCLPGLQTFLSAIVPKLEEIYDVQSYYGADASPVGDLINWADLIWFEWANEMLIHCSQQYEAVLKEKKVLVRLHSYEVLGEHCKQVNWKVVDTIIFVADHIREVFKQVVPGVLGMVESHVVHNGVDTQRFRRFASA